MHHEERAQVSFEYLLTAVFAIIVVIGTVLAIETLREMALDAQAQLLQTRARVIDSIMR